jgi:hypothetical protein
LARNRRAIRSKMLMTEFLKGATWSLAPQFQDFRD